MRPTRLLAPMRRVSVLVLVACGAQAVIAPLPTPTHPPTPAPTPTERATELMTAQLDAAKQIEGRDDNTPLRALFAADAVILTNGGTKPSMFSGELLTGEGPAASGDGGEIVQLTPTATISSSGSKPSS